MNRKRGQQPMRLPIQKSQHDCKEKQRNEGWKLTDVHSPEYDRTDRDRQKAGSESEKICLRLFSFRRRQRIAFGTCRNLIANWPFLQLRQQRFLKLFQPTLQQNPKQKLF